MSGLPWIKLHTNMPEHPKSDELEAVLGAPRAWTYVLELWLWASRTRPTGDLAGMSDAVIAKRSGWSGDAERFVGALISTGWLTEDRALAGWEEYQGLHVARAAQDEEKAARCADAVALVEALGGVPAAVAATGIPKQSVYRWVQARNAPSDEALERMRVALGSRSGHAQVTPSLTESHAGLTEMESEIEIEKEIPPTGGVGGEPSAPAPRPPKQRGPTWDELMAQDHEGRPFIEFARLEFPALDGLNGRPSLDEVLANAREWWELQRGRRRWQTYRGALAWLRRDYPRHRGSWERDRASDGGGRVRSGPPSHDLHGNRIVTRPGYVWDETDARFLAEGRAWLGPEAMPPWSEPREIRA